jgi:hypothetical protein
MPIKPQIQVIVPMASLLPSGYIHRIPDPLLRRCQDEGGSRQDPVKKFPNHRQTARLSPRLLCNQSTPNLPECPDHPSVVYARVLVKAVASNVLSNMNRICESFVWRTHAAAVSYGTATGNTSDHPAAILLNPPPIVNKCVCAGCGRLEWLCLDWNKPSIGFYLSLSAVSMDDWTVYRISGEPLTQLAGRT